MSLSAPRQHLLLIREMPGQAGANDCCGNLASDPAMLASAEELSPWMDATKQIGGLYNAVRERFDSDQVDITMIDPRAQIVMWFKLIQHVWLFRPPAGGAFRLLMQRFSIPAVIVNGRIVSSVHLPTPEQLLAELRTETVISAGAS